DAEAFRGLDAVVLVEGGVVEFAERYHIPRLMPGADDDAGRVVRTSCEKAESRETFHLGCVPAAFFSKSEPAETNSCGDEFLGFSPLHLAADMLEFGGHLSGQHLQV